VTRLAFIDREKAYYNVAALCRLLRASRSGFYVWRSRPPSALAVAVAVAVADEVLIAQIRTTCDDSRQVYGAPRIHAELADADVRVGRKRVARLVRQAEIVGCHRRKRVNFASPDHPNRSAATTVGRRHWRRSLRPLPRTSGAAARNAVDGAPGTLPSAYVSV
jgi:putative transposase